VPFEMVINPLVKLFRFRIPFDVFIFFIESKELPDKLKLIVVALTSKEVTVE